MVYGAFSEGFDRLWEAHFLTGFTLPVVRLPWIGQLDPIAWFGIFDLNAYSMRSALVLSGVILARLLALYTWTGMR